MTTLKSFLPGPCFGLILGLGLLTGLAHAAAGEKALPFHIGEKLSYTLKWGFLPVGTAEFEVLDGGEAMNAPSYLFRLSAKSFPVIDLIYKVRDRIESYTDRSMTHALFYRKKQREGRHERDVTVEFDWTRSKAHYFNKGRRETTVDILPGTFDPLSIFYAFRLNTLRDNLEVTTPVTDGKKAVIGMARVIRRERVRVPAGEFDTFLVEPDLQHLRGVFEKSKDAKIQAWVTADERRIVVKIRSKVVVGHFVAELISSEVEP